MKQINPANANLGKREGTSSSIIASGRTAAVDGLFRAYSGAQETKRPLTEFALELTDLRAAGVGATDLRWLVSMRYADHLLEVTRLRDAKRRFRISPSLAFKDNSCFVLTQRGVVLAMELEDLRRPPSDKCESNTACVPPRPRWDPATRELWVGEELVRRFLNKAPNQVTILTAFQEEGWPEHLDDPLPPNGHSERNRKLHDAINKLNRHQILPLIQFRGDGTGRGLCWRLGPESTP